MPFRKDDDMVSLLSHLMDGSILTGHATGQTPTGQTPAGEGRTGEAEPRRRTSPAALDARGNVIELVAISAFVQKEYQKLLRRLGDVDVHNVARVLGDGALLLSCSASTGQFVLRIESREWHWRRPVS